MAPYKSQSKSKLSKTASPARSFECATLNRGVNSAERFRMKKQLPSLSKIIIPLLLLLSAPAAHPQSLWQEASSRSIVADKRAHNVGDILSILIQESNTAN